MNKIYKIIWSKTRNCYVVASELAKSSGKSGFSLSKKIMAALVISSLSFSYFGCSEVEAHTKSVTTKGFIGKGQVFTSEPGNSIGTSISAYQYQGNTLQLNNINFKVSTPTAGTARSSLGLTLGAYIYDEKTDGYKNINSSLYFTDTDTITTLTAADDSVKITLDEDALKNGYYKYEIKANGVHYYSVNANPEEQDNYDNKGATGTNAMAAGIQAKADGVVSTAVGYNAHAIGDTAVAVGTSVTATGNQSVALGTSANAEKDSSIAIGTSVTAKGPNSIAIGTGVTAEGQGAVALGSYGASAKGNGSMAFGQGSTAEGGGGATAKGAGATAFGVGSTAEGDYSTAFGGGGARAKGTGATAFGTNSFADGAYSTAFGGGGATAKGAGATAFGNGTTAGILEINEETGAVTKTTYNDTAFGTGSTATGGSSTAFGAGGTRALGAGSTAFGIGSTASGSYSTAFGAGGTNAKGTGATAFGVGTQAAGVNSTAFGQGSYAGGLQTGISKDLRSNFMDIRESLPSYNNTLPSKAYFYVGNTRVDGKKRKLAVYNGDVATVNGSYVYLSDQGNMVVEEYAGYNTWKIYKVVEDTSTPGRLRKGAETKTDKLVTVTGAFTEVADVPNGTAWGENTRAASNHSTAWGANTLAVGTNSTAWGTGANATGAISTAWGTDTIANGAESTAWGVETLAKAEQSTAWGAHTIAFEVQSTAWGGNTLASGVAATAFGGGTVASGGASTAWGASSKAKGINSTAFGDRAIASGYASTAFGQSTIASGVLSTAWGEGAKTEGWLLNGSTPVTTRSVSGHQDPTTGIYLNKMEFRYNNQLIGTVEEKLNRWKEKYWGSVTYDPGWNGGSVGYHTGGNATTAFGHNTIATGVHATAFGSGSAATNNQTTAFGKDTVASADTATAFGSGSTAAGPTSTAFGRGSTARGDVSTAWGITTQALDHAATSFGQNTIAGANYSTAFGNSTKATGVSATSFGWGTTASGTYSTAFGQNTEAIGNDATSFGMNTLAIGQSATAFGSHAVAGRPSYDGKDVVLELTSNGKYTAKDLESGSILVTLDSWGDVQNGYSEYDGHKVNVQTAYDFVNRKYVYNIVDRSNNEVLATYDTSEEANAAVTHKNGIDFSQAVFATAFGQNNIAGSSHATAFGQNNNALGTMSTAFGQNNLAQGFVATAFGQNNKAEKEFDTVFGTGNTAKGGASTVFGQGNKTDGWATTAFGQGTKATAWVATAFGAGSAARGGASTAFGMNASANGYNSLAALGGTTGEGGTWDDGQGNSGEWVNGEVGNAAVAIGEGSQAYENYTYAIGQNALTGRKAANAIAIGNGAETVRWDNDAGDFAAIDSALAIGTNAKADATDAISIGHGSEVYGEKSIAIGTGNKIYGAKSSVIGDPNTLSGEDNHAHGNDNNIYVDHGYILGSESSVGLTSSVALGYQSATGETLYATPSMTVNGTKYDFAGGAPVGTVSVGAEGKERTITNVAAGRISATSTDAINGSQLYFAIQALNEKVVVEAGDSSVNVDSKVEPEDAAGAGTTGSGTTSGGATDAGNTESGTTTGGNDTTTTTGGNTGATAGGDSGEIEPTRTTTYIVTANTTTAEAGSDNLTVEDSNPGGDDKTHHYTIDLAKDIHVTNVTVDNNVKVGDKTTIEGDKITVGDTVIEGDQITTKTVNGDTINTKTINLGDTTIEEGDDNHITYKKGGNTYNIATVEDGMDYAGDDGKAIHKNLAEQLDIVGGAADKASEYNIYTYNDGDKLRINLAKDIKGVDSVTVNKTVKVGDKTTIEGDKITVGDTVIEGDQITTKTVKAGDTTINNDGFTIKNGPSITKNGIDVGGKKITNVAPGTDGTDAVNVNQLREANQDIYNSMNRLDNSTRKGIAGAAALAALHPLDFDPDDKWEFSAGVGNYRGETAAAIGAFYHPNDDTIFSLGATVGNGENLVNGGVTFRFGQQNHQSRSKKAMAKEIVELRAEVAELKAMVYSMANGRMPGLDLTKSEEFPDTPENHWAYDYVSVLAGNGVLEGYQDGFFKGDRTLTRYEMAAIIYRAMMRGVDVDERMKEEFAPELARVKVDTLTSHSDGTPSIQRVRVIKGRE